MKKLWSIGQALSSQTEVIDTGRRQIVAASAGVGLGLPAGLPTGSVSAQSSYGVQYV